MLITKKRRKLANRFDVTTQEAQKFRKVLILKGKRKFTFEAKACLTFL